MKSTPAPEDASGLVISDKTARADTDIDTDSLFESRFVSPNDLVQAAEGFVHELPGREKWDRSPRYTVELSPGSVRISRFAAVPNDLSDNYKPRTAIVGWSRKSRSAMIARLCSLDYLPLLGDTNRIPALVTLTYPGEWESVSPTGEHAKRHLKMFRSRYERKFGEPLRAVWKMEFQLRGAPHFHLFCVPPVAAGFRDWLSETWADIVAHPDPEQRAKHQRAGTGLDFEQGLRSSDAKRVAVYFSKHGSANFGSKEYQNQPPDLWIESGNVGRFWGYWGLHPLIIKSEISNRDAQFLARTLRRWTRANSRTVRVEVQRTNMRTGVISARKVTRRAQGLFAGRLGFVSVNDGSEMGRALGRAVAVCCRRWAAVASGVCQMGNVFRRTQHACSRINTRQ